MTLCENPSLVILNMITGLSLLYAFGTRLWRLAMEMSVSNINEFSASLQRAKSTTMTGTTSTSGSGNEKPSATDTTTMSTPIPMSYRNSNQDRVHEWSEYQKGTKLDIKQIGLLRVIAKNTLLGGIAIIVIQIYFVFQWIELYKKNHYGWDIWSRYLCTRYILRTVVTSIEIFCVYLSFGVNGKLFNLLCGKFANGLQLCCQVRMKKKIKAANDYELSLLH